MKSNNSSYLRNRVEVYLLWGVVLNILADSMLDMISLWVFGACQYGQSMIDKQSDF